MVKRNSSYEEDEGYELPEKKRKGFGHNDGDEGENEGDGGDGHGDGNSLAKPIGEVVRVSRKGRSLRKHYKYFESEGEIYTLENEVLLSPEKPHEKPYIAIIKDITQDEGGDMLVTGQWFYRPEEAKRYGGGIWQARDTRELYYSFHLDEVPADSVMHKCIVHYIPVNKQVPLRTEHPGFIVQKVYDTEKQKLKGLIDNDYDNEKQLEIKLLVEKTRERLGGLPKIVKDASTNMGNHLKSILNLRKKNMPTVNATRDEGVMRCYHQMKLEKPRDSFLNGSKYRVILEKFQARTEDPYRDRWLEKLLEGLEPLCNSKENNLDIGRICWPDTAVSVINALEKASFDALASDFQKYNQKIRQLVFNLKNNTLLARRLLNKELDPVDVVNMTPQELKDGLTAEDRPTREPEVSERMQMTDARCSRCLEKKVGVADIIQAGRRGDRYQLECIVCGHTWFSSQDGMSSLTVDTPNITQHVGTSPLATAELKAIKKSKAMPSGTEKQTANVYQKAPATQKEKWVKR